MKPYTLGFLFRNGKIILAKKKRKIGVDKWNGYGGKIQDGEDAPGSLAREMKEESGVLVQKADCMELGLLDCHFEGKDEINRVHVFRIDAFLGEPKETEEMGLPKEFELGDVPYSEMMAADVKFVPLVIAQKKFKGEVWYSQNGELLKYDMVEIGDEIKKEIKIK